MDKNMKVLMYIFMGYRILFTSVSLIGGHYGR